MLDILTKNYKFKLVILLFFIITCFIRHPNFDEAVWKSSDTNYQCLMNVSAMQQTNRLSGKILPIITYSDGTDYGLEYSSGVLDKVSHQYFYYVSFPAFPYVILKFYFDITALPISVEALFIFCNILYGLALWFTISMFQYLLSEKISDNIIVFVSGMTFCCSTEIMHSLGLTYWGHNWYMLFFPLLVIAFMEYIKSDTKKNKLMLLIFLFLIMQTDWTGYLVVGIILLLLIFQNKGKNIFRMCMAVVGEMFISVMIYLLPNIHVVGKTELINALMLRAEGRMRNIEYSIYDRWIVLLQSFGILLFICIFIFVWCVLERKEVKFIKEGIRENKISIALFTIPILENFILSNHAMTYSMDRMKIYYILCFIILLMMRVIKDNYAIKNLMILLIAFCMLINLGAYRFIDNSYLWNDDRLEDSRILAEYIMDNFDDSAMGQLGSDSVWGYSKLLFGKGIEKNSTTDSIDLRAKNLNKRYAISLNGVNLSNTQYWYTSAVIHDLEKDDYTIIGTIPNQYDALFDDFAFLKYFEKITVYKNGFADEMVTLNDEYIRKADDLEVYLENVYNDDSDGKTLYYIAHAQKIPSIIKLSNITQNEWERGIDYNNNRVIVDKSNSNMELFENAKSFIVNNDEILIKGVQIDQNYIFITLDQTSEVNLKEMEYPNNIEVNMSIE